MDSEYRWRDIVLQQTNFDFLAFSKYIYVIYPQSVLSAICPLVPNKTKASFFPFLLFVSWKWIICGFLTGKLIKGDE